MSVRCEIVVHPERGNPISAVTENLGTGGVCILLPKPLERFSTCRLRLQLNDPLPPIDCTGKVVWIIPTKKDAKETKPSYDIGIEFVNLSEEADGALRRLIQEHADLKAQG